MSEDKNALAQRLEVPAHLADLITPDVKANPKNLEDMGQIDSSDFGLNILKFASDKQQLPNWGGNNEPPLAINTMILSQSNTIVPPGTDVVLLVRSKLYMYRVGDGADSQLVFQTRDKTDPRIVKMKGLAFRKEGDKTLPPLVTEYINFYFMSQYNMEEPAVMSFKRTSFPIGRALSRDLFRATKGWKLPIRACKFKLGEPAMQSNGIKSWPQLVITPNGFISADGKEVANKLHEVAVELDRTLKDEAASSLDDGSSAEPDANMASAHPAPNETDVLNAASKEVDAVVVETPAANAPQAEEKNPFGSGPNATPDAAPEKSLF